MKPRTKYAKSGGLNIAYQVLGEGSVDLILSPGWVTHLELAWAVPPLARFLERLASFSRLILFDKRGTGLSDRVDPDRLPSLPDRMDDIRVVMDAAGSERAVLFGLFISPKTVGPHVSNILAKLWVERRAEAAALAQRLGLLST